MSSILCQPLWCIHIGKRGLFRNQSGTVDPTINSPGTILVEPLRFGDGSAPLTDQNRVKFNVPPDSATQSSGTTTSVSTADEKLLKQSYGEPLYLAEKHINTPIMIKSNPWSLHLRRNATAEHLRSWLRCPG
jgi:hypothetical protein